MLLLLLLLDVSLSCIPFFFVPLHRRNMCIGSRFQFHCHHTSCTWPFWLLHMFNAAAGCEMPLPYGECRSLLIPSAYAQSRSVSWLAAVFCLSFARAHFLSLHLVPSLCPPYVSGSLSFCPFRCVCSLPVSLLTLAR